MYKLLFSPLRLVRFGIRLAGLRNFTLLALGVGVGLLVAPKTGAQFRQELAARLEQRRMTSGGGSPSPSPAPAPSPEPVPSPSTAPASNTPSTTLSGTSPSVASVPPGSKVTSTPATP
jgi:hypothetical protein